MWFPAQLNADAKHNGLLTALASVLSSHVHVHVIQDRIFANAPSDSSTEGVARTVKLLTQCTAAYVGTSNMKPSAPYCAFTIAPELGIAYLEHLIDYDQLTPSSFGERWLAASLYQFINALVSDYPAVENVVSALPIDGIPPAGFVQTPVDDRFHVTKHT